MIDREQWAEDHGFSRGRCPSCRRSMWIEYGCVVECNSCGWSNERDEHEERAEDEEEVTS